jgi:GNAT superfamily N-acetyltransferase
VSATIREATSEDARAIAEIRIASWRATYAGIVPQSVLDRMDVDRTVDRICGLLASDSHVLVLDTPEGGVVGYAFVAPARDDDAAGLGEIEAIYLHPNAQGSGLGGGLLAAASDALAARGFDTLVLWVLTANTPARGFYEHAGFAPDGAARTLDFDGEPIEEIRYRRGPDGPK